MSRNEIISYISDEMLLNSDEPERVPFITKIARLAIEDNHMFQLMQDWMKITDPHIKKSIELEMKAFLWNSFMG